MGSKQTLYYADVEGFECEIGDVVEIEVQTENFGAMEFRGEVTAIHPRNGRVRVLYNDTTDFARSTGEARVKSKRLPIADVTLIARGS
jgi:hypothetical protein